MKKKEPVNKEKDFANKNEKNIKKQKLNDLKKQKKEADKEIDELKEDTLGSKIKGFLMFLAILLLVFGIFAGMIKADIGGFGSGVLAPIIGNISGLNKILPNNSIQTSTKDTSTEDSATSADSASSGVTNDVASANTQSSTSAQTDTTQSSDTQASASSQSSTETQSSTSSQSSQDSQSSTDTALADYVATYSKMDAKSAAAILNNMTNDLNLVTDILANMDATKRANIMAKMDVNVASKVTVLLSQYYNLN